MKKKRIVKTMIIALSFVVILFVALCMRYFIERHNNSYTFERRMNFTIPDYAVDYVELQKDITEEEEALDIKFEIPEEKLSDFIDLLETSDYYLDEVYEDKKQLHIHPENTCENWDLDYEKLDKVYLGHNTRNEITFWLGKAVHRCHIHIFILKPENGKVQIYLSYNG